MPHVTTDAPVHTFLLLLVISTIWKSSGSKSGLCQPLCPVVYGVAVSQHIVPKSTPRGTHPATNADSFHSRAELDLTHGCRSTENNFSAPNPEEVAEAENADQTRLVNLFYYYYYDKASNRGMRHLLTIAGRQSRLCGGGGPETAQKPGMRRSTSIKPST
ncbi:hypothetical protein F4809DRAFT_460860 [Biscogniauxia mediterranea]|nr:hypothetical protein F4809DRAFT_460860 [Biscogniauxia mediterranea]